MCIIFLHYNSLIYSRELSIKSTKTVTVRLLIVVSLRSLILVPHLAYIRNHEGD